MRISGLDERATDRTVVSPLDRRDLLPRPDSTATASGTTMKVLHGRADHPEAPGDRATSPGAFFPRIRRRPNVRSIVLAVVLALDTTTGIADDAFRSAPLARDLVRALQASSRDAIAAADPASPGRFIAALSVPGQLLVVSAVHPSPAVVAERIRMAMHREVYLDLQGTPTPKGKLFVQDAGADGLLHARPNSGGVDVVYRDGSTSLRFDGDPRAQSLDDRQYDALFARADTEYAHMLDVLKVAATSATSTH
jgi:hypothetical protein